MTHVGLAVIYKDHTGHVVDALIVRVGEGSVVDLIFVGLCPLRIQIETDVPYCPTNVLPDEEQRCWAR